MNCPHCHQWWIGIRFGKWGFAVYLDGHTSRWIDPVDLYGIVIGRGD